MHRIFRYSSQPIFSSELTLFLLSLKSHKIFYSSLKPLKLKSRKKVFKIDHSLDLLSILLRKKSDIRDKIDAMEIRMKIYY